MAFQGYRLSVEFILRMSPAVVMEDEVLLKGLDLIDEAIGETAKESGYQDLDSRERTQRAQRIRIENTLRSLRPLAANIKYENHSLRNHRRRIDGARVRNSD